MDPKTVAGKEEESGSRRRDKEIDGYGKGEKLKKRIKMVKEEEDDSRQKHDRRVRKEKRKKEKERARMEKLTKAQRRISIGTSPDSSACSRLTPGEEERKNKLVHSKIDRERMHTSGDVNSLFGDERLFKRELTPELARISALTEGPPKSKCDCKRGWFARTTTCPHASRTSSSRSHPPHLERADLSTSSRRKPSSPPSLERADVSKLKAALKAYCDERRPRREVELEPPVLEPLDPVAYYYDSDGNKVWICPTCGGQDDGSPMIGCDGCDAWYHWVCVGMNVAPDENEDWYCRHCLAKRKERMRGRNSTGKRKFSS